MQGFGNAIGNWYRISRWEIVKSLLFRKWAWDCFKLYAKEESSDSTGSMTEHQSSAKIFGFEHYRGVRFWKYIDVWHRISRREIVKSLFFRKWAWDCFKLYAKEESSDSTGSMTEHQSSAKIFGFEHYRGVRFWKYISIWHRISSVRNSLEFTFSEVSLRLFQTICQGRIFGFN